MKVAKLTVLNSVVLAASGGLVWLALDVIGTPSSVSLWIYWIWVFVGAVSLTYSLGFKFALAMSIVSALSFAVIPALRAALGLPADFRGVRGFVVLLQIGIPAMLMVYCAAGLFARFILKRVESS